MKYALHSKMAEYDKHLAHSVYNDIVAITQSDRNNGLSSFLNSHVNNLYTLAH